MKALLKAAGSLLVACVCTCGIAAEFPAKPIRLIVPTAAGSSTDTVARVIAERLSKGLGQQVVVDNQPNPVGAASTIAKATPDGYTIMLATAGQFVAPTLEKMPYEPLKDFTNIALVGIVNKAVVAHPSLPVSDVTELRRYVRQNRISIGSPGGGSMGHLAAAWLAAELGKDAAVVPYKGAGPMAADVTGGLVQVAVMDVGAAAPLISQGKLKALAVTDGRSAELLGGKVAPVAASLPGFVVTDWRGLVGPPKLPGSVIGPIVSELAKALNDEEVQTRFRSAGIEAVIAKPELIEQVIRAQQKTFGELANKTSFKVN